jgi:hypothetical protein
MDRKTIVIEVDDITRDETGVIVLHRTGIMYSAQCDGLACNHPEVEGYVLPFGYFGQDLNDCAFGCQYLSRPEFEQERQTLATVINEYAVKYCEGYKCKFTFDFSRIDELKEGWWPMLLNGTFAENKYTNQPVIVCTGNCD